MKTITYNLIIDAISSVSGSGSVDVSFHREGGNLGHGARDGFETARMVVDTTADIADQVAAKLGETETVDE
jgi:hypothetical protein